MTAGLPIESIAKALCGVRNCDGWLVRCPVPTHGRGRGDANPSLSIGMGRSGKLLVRCFAGCDSIAVLRELELRGICGLPVENPRRPSPEPPTRQRKIQGARALWRACRSSDGSLVETYLRSRGITIQLPRSIQFAPSIRHTESGRMLPCMVAAVQDVGGAIVAVHRTYLRQDGSGKADVTNSKKMLGPCAGGAVRLSTAGAVLAVGEGIETCLAVRQAQPTLAVWAALSATGLERIAIPDHVRELVILADRDARGEQAVDALKRRPDLTRLDVRVARPPMGVKDFNDLLNAPSSDAARYG